MKTTVLRVEEAAPGKSAYPIKLFFDDGSSGWLDKPIAKASMSATLADPAPPTDDAGNTMDPEGIVPFLLSQEASSSFLAIGQYLQRQVAPGKVGASWAALAAEHGAPAGEGLRTILDIRPESLRRLPWELIATAGDVRLFLNPLNPWYRRPMSAQPVPPAELGPLRILIVVGSRESDIQAEQEVAEIQRAVRQVGVAHVIRGPDRLTLERTYQEWRPHILHFIGHGDQLPGSGPVLFLGDGPSRWRLSREEIVNWLPGWTGRLAILNACRTDGAPTSEVHAASASLAEAFGERGFAAVVGIQGDIDAAAAAAFSKPLYEAIGGGEPLDVAIAKARNAIKAETDLKRRDWALPSLTISGSPDEVLAVQLPEPVIELAAAPEFTSIREFVGRGHERMGLWRRLDPEGFGLEPSALTLLVGGQDYGKTWLIYQVLWICAVRARAVRYVDLASEQSLDFLDVLRRIRDGSANTGIASSPLKGPLPAKVFRQFNHIVNHVAIGEIPSDTVPKGPIPDDGARYQPGIEDGVERIFDAFTSALEAVAKEGPLVIALDHVGGVERANFHLVCQHLLRRALLKRIPGVRLIVALTNDELGDHWPQEMDPRDLQIRVDRIEPIDFMPLAREYFLHRGIAQAQFDEAVGSVGTVTEEWVPKKLKFLLAFLQS